MVPPGKERIKTTANTTAVISICSVLLMAASCYNHNSFVESFAFHPPNNGGIQTRDQLQQQQCFVEQQNNTPWSR